eukprot:34985_1
MVQCLIHQDLIIIIIIIKDLYHQRHHKVRHQHKKIQNYVATMKNNKSQPSMIIASQRKLDGLGDNTDSISANSNEKMIGKHNTQHTIDGSLIVLDYDINDLDDMENERLEEEEI